MFVFKSNLYLSMLRIHASYHKCLIMYFLRVMENALNRTRLKQCSMSSTGMCCSDMGIEMGGRNSNLNLNSISRPWATFSFK